MKRLSLPALVAASLFALTAAASAEQRPNFSGTWVALSPAD